MGTHIITYISTELFDYGQQPCTSGSACKCMWHLTAVSEHNSLHTGEHLRLLQQLMRLGCAALDMKLDVAARAEGAQLLSKENSQASRVRLGACGGATACALARR